MKSQALAHSTDPVFRVGDLWAEYRLLVRDRRILKTRVTAQRAALSTSRSHENGDALIKAQKELEEHEKEIMRMRKEMASQPQVFVIS